jgi:2-polyprenyl-3-methyl-5-hydroxy-6-metoxy-1,4-benzoquinol methylase
VTLQAPQTRLESVTDACAAVRADVERGGSSDDIGYFKYHEQRLRATAARVQELVPTTVEVLDIGSHYLHLSSVLVLLGYRMSAIDVPAFARLPLVVERAARIGIALTAVEGDDIAAGQFLTDQSDRFGAVLFCEILEHITFNPIAFWQRVHTLLRVNGLILVTTPNSLKLLSVFGAFWNLLSLRRIGLSVKQIMHHGTFGHHWKEYSAREVVEYFGRLSPDFKVHVRKIHYGAPSREVREGIGAVRTAILRFGNATGFFADNLEAVVTLQQKTPWSGLSSTAG